MSEDKIIQAAINFVNSPVDVASYGDASRHIYNSFVVGALSEAAKEYWYSLLQAEQEVESQIAAQSHKRGLPKLSGPIISQEDLEAWEKEESINALRNSFWKETGEYHGNLIEYTDWLENKIAEHNAYTLTAPKEYEE